MTCAASMLKTTLTSSRGKSRSETSEQRTRLGPAILSFVERFSSFGGYFVHNLAHVITYSSVTVEASLQLLLAFFHLTVKIGGGAATSYCGCGQAWNPPLQDPGSIRP